MIRTSIALLLAWAAAVAAWGQQPTLYDDRPKISVSGEAVVNVEPDQIVIRFGIETSNADMRLAKEKNSAILKKAINVIKECGVPPKEIRTDRLSIEPRYKDRYNRFDFIDYLVQNGFAVTLKDPAKVEDLISGVLQAGVNYVHGVEFQTTEFKKFREQAREMALRAAKEKAEKMAAVLGQTIGAPLQIQEDYYGSRWWYYSSWGGWGSGSGRDQGMSQNAMQNVSSGGSSEPSESIALGKIGIRASVNVTFELQPAPPAQPAAVMR